VGGCVASKKCDNSKLKLELETETETETGLQRIQVPVAIGIQRQNLILAICVAAAAVFLFLWGCPYLQQFGHGKLCIALYVLLLLIYVYGRASGARRRQPKAKIQN
jgi:hypothetical protein